MAKVTIEGWNQGFNKVQFNLFLQDRFDLGLAEAKAVVDRILEHERVELEFQHLSAADRKRILDLGVNCAES